MTQVLLSSLRWNKFLVSLLIPIQFFFPWVTGCHLIIWDAFHKTISSLFFSLLVFQQLHSTLLLKMPFQTLLWQKLAFSSTFFYLNDLSSISLFRRHCDVALFNPSFCFVKIMLLSFAYPFNRSVVPFCSSSFRLIKPCISFQPNCCLRFFLPLAPFIQ